MSVNLRDGSRELAHCGLVIGRRGAGGWLSEGVEGIVGGSLGGVK